MTQPEYKTKRELFLKYYSEIFNQKRMTREEYNLKKQLILTKCDIKDSTFYKYVRLFELKKPEVEKKIFNYEYFHKKYLDKKLKNEN